MSIEDGAFKRLIVEGWRQFESIDISIHPRLTILTGANGCGKTTLIGLFARHFGVHREYLATPKVDEKGQITFSLGVAVERIRNFFRRASIPPEAKNQVGRIDYVTGASSAILVPQSAHVTYSMEFSNQRTLEGIMIPSHRPISNYQPVGNIPVNAMLPQAAYSTYFNEVITRQGGGHTGYSPVYRMKEALISMATFGPGNERMPRNEQAYNTLLKFENVLKATLPKTLGFNRIIVRQSDVVLDTESGEFLLDAASGGVMALIDICWQIHLYSMNHEHFVVVLDEPENHLHPSMQRSLMRDLIAAFPTAQFIVATHSPFVVSSVKDSKVYALRYFVDEKRMPTERRRIYSEELDLVDKSGTANEILREVLGVPITAPEWVEQDLQAIVSKYSADVITADKLSALKTELRSAGLGEYFSDALVGLSRGQ